MVYKSTEEFDIPKINKIFSETDPNARESLMYTNGDYDDFCNDTTINSIKNKKMNNTTAKNTEKTNKRRKPNPVAKPNDEVSSDDD